MTAFKLIPLAIVAAAAMLPTARTLSQAAPKRLIVVSLADRRLALVEDGRAFTIYDVAVGKPSTPSPVGTFTIERRVANPTYHHDGKTVLPGPNNPVGTRWMGLTKHGYGIHGTSQPGSIGKAASHGCIRMAKKDLGEFYELVAEGDTVQLVGQRNQETAQLFGDPQAPPAAALVEPILTATARRRACRPPPARRRSRASSPRRATMPTTA